MENKQQILNFIDEIKGINEKLKIMLKGQKKSGIKKESINLIGSINLKHFRNNKLIDARNIRNIVTNAGFAAISGLLLSDISVNDFDEIAIGIGAIGGTADSGSTIITVDTERTEANDYWNGVTISYITGDNAGESQVISDFDAATNTMTHGAFSNSVSNGDQYKLSPRPISTALESEIITGGGERRTGANVVGTRVTTTIANDTAQLTTTFTFTAAFAIDECGVFNDPSIGDMLCGQAFGEVNVISNDSLQVTWQIQFS